MGNLNFARWKMADLNVRAEARDAEGREKRPEDRQRQRRGNEEERADDSDERKRA